MTIELSKEEKQAIVNQHIRSLLVNKYNVEISLIEENSISPVNQSTITLLNNQVNYIDTKINALQEELESL